MSNLTSVQESSTTTKVFVVTQTASKFESLVAQYLKAKNPQEKDFPQEIQTKIKMQDDAIKAARNELKYKTNLFNQQCEFEKQRADEEYEEFLYNLERQQQN